jgi:prophage antirepressor-like protein
MNTLEAVTTLVEFLSDEQIKSLLVKAIRMLEARGLATPDDYVTLGLLGEMPGYSVNMHGMVEAEKGQSMDTAIQMFRFENKQEVRVIEDEGGDPLFVAKDICAAVELNDVSRATDYLDADEKGTREVRTLGGMQRMLCVTESGMYTLIIRSNKPEAKRFRKWITSEVLPSIRKHGSYVMPGRQGASLAHQALAMAQALVDLEERTSHLEEAEASRRRNEVRTLAVGLSVDSAEYYPITAYANIRGLRISNNAAVEYGRRATRWSKENGYPIGHVSDSRWGRVNTYHVEALEFVFDVDG